MATKMLFVFLLTLQTAAPSNNTRMRTIDLYSDNRAYRVNDIVTVLITESSSASEEAKTVTGKKNSLQAKVSALWNNNIAGKIFGKAGDSVDYPSMDITSDMSFDGNG
ncbi:MAG TPA: flagellar basal body L-ring protein FlgH, partial [bacterium]|nr:flagellar basal body L-ring protein FlgH [bacterium]